MSSNNGSSNQSNNFDGNANRHIVNFERDQATGTHYVVYSDGSRVPNDLQGGHGAGVLPSFGQGFGHLPTAGFGSANERLPPPPGLGWERFSAPLGEQDELPPPPGLARRQDAPYLDSEAPRMPPPVPPSGRVPMESGVVHGTWNAPYGGLGHPGSSSHRPGLMSNGGAALSDDDDCFPPPEAIGEAANPLRKTSTTRRSSPPPTKSKGKGKQRADPAQEPSSSARKRRATTAAGPPTNKRATKSGGRARGAPNYTTEDKLALEELLLVLLPIGSREWDRVMNDYNERARAEGRPERDAASLKKKHEQMVRTTKPTGRADCPPEIEMAHEVEHEICNKAGSRELGDSEIESEDDAIDITSSDEAPKPATASGKETKPQVATAARPASSGVVRRVPSVRPRAGNNQLLENLANRLDPATQAARDDARAASTMQMTQALTLSSQLRDLQVQNATLNQQLRDAEQRRHDAERRADMAELRFEFIGTPAARERALRPSDPRVAHSSGRSSSPPIRFRQDIFYPGGGRFTGWLSSDMSEEDRAGLGLDEPGVRGYVTTEAEMAEMAERTAGPSSWHRDRDTNFGPYPPSQHGQEDG
ncbi:hypothetical protein HDZ31DRAFT_77433 [Schizophyllum fasciatum]